MARLEEKKLIWLSSFLKTGASKTIHCTADYCSFLSTTERHNLVYIFMDLIGTNFSFCSDSLKINKSNI